MDRCNSLSQVIERSREKAKVEWQRHSVKSWEISWHRNWNLVFMYTHAAHSAWIENSPRQFEVIHSDLHESWPGEYKNGQLLGEFCENHSHPSSRDSRRSPVNTTGLPGPRCFNGGCGSLPVLWFLHVATVVYPLIVIIWFKTPRKRTWFQVSFPDSQWKLEDPGNPAGAQNPMAPCESACETPGTEMQFRSDCVCKHSAIGTI